MNMGKRTWLDIVSAQCPQIPAGVAAKRRQRYDAPLKTMGSTRRRPRASSLVRLDRLAVKPHKERTVMNSNRNILIAAVVIGLFVVIIAGWYFVFEATVEPPPPPAATEPTTPPPPAVK
jgi:hypothetical protein